MAKLTKTDVRNMAKLAKLNLTAEETDKFQKQLSKIVDYISELEEVNTSDLQPTSQTTGLENVFRIDEVKTSNCLSLDGYFVVDAILSAKDE